MLATTAGRGPCCSVCTRSRSSTWGFWCSLEVRNHTSMTNTMIKLAHTDKLAHNHRVTHKRVHRNKDKLTHNHTSMTKNLDDSYLHIQHCVELCPFTSAFIRSTPWSSGYFTVDITPNYAEATNGVAPTKEKHKSAIYITHTVRCQRVTHMRAYNF